MSDRDPSPIPPRAARACAALACVVGAWYLGAGWADERHLSDANAAGRAGDFRGAIEEARRVTHAPAQARALVVEGHAELALGNAAAAAAAFARAADAAPNDAGIRRAWAAALTRAGRTTQAARQLARASALDPGGALPPGFER